MLFLASKHREVSQRSLEGRNIRVEVKDEKARWLDAAARTDWLSREAIMAAEKVLFFVFVCSC